MISLRSSISELDCNLYNFLLEEAAENGIVSEAVKNHSFDSRNHSVLSLSFLS